MRLNRVPRGREYGRWLRRAVAFAVCVAGLAGTARAVVIRGYMTDAYGKPLRGGQVRLMQSGTAVAIAFVGPDGAFELRSSASGRFTLLGQSRGYLPGIGEDFYAGAIDVLDRDLVLATDSVQQQMNVSATGIPTPLPQVTAATSVIPADALQTAVALTDALRHVPGDFVVQTGQYGGVTSLFVRGGNSSANLVTVDGMPAGDVGGVFDFANVSSTGIGKVDVLRGPNSAMYGTDAGAGVVAMETPRGFARQPVLTYSGEAGSFHTYRNEVTGSGALGRLDYYGAFSRLDSSNDLPLDRYHLGTEALNVGYGFNGNTHLRATLRNADAAVGLPGAWDFQGIAHDGKQGDQDLLSTVTLENRYKGDWHNLLRYGMARKREQEHQYGNQGTPITFFAGTPNAYTEYFGNLLTIHGANGYTARGQAAIFGNNLDQASNRDELYYQSDYNFSRHVIGLFGFRYDRERGSFNDADFGEAEKTQRTNFEYNAQFQGEFFDRLFYSAGGAIEKNHLYGIAGTPRIGLSYVPVRPRAKLFHGTRLRANAATGVQEPTLAIEENSLYRQLVLAGDTADIAKYHIGPQAAERSRTYDLGLDQNVLGDRLVMKFGYFHNVFDRQLEGVSSPALEKYFGLKLTNLPATASLYEAYLNSLAFRAQGAEYELRWQLKPNLLVMGGYTYLDTRVVQSFASDAVAANQGAPTQNPNLPGIAIGAEGPLVGARPFRRAPHTGYFDVNYSRRKLVLDIKGAMASRSDDSTFLDGLDTNQASFAPNASNTLLLPNRNLDYGYVRLDMGLTYALKHGFTYFAQMDNLLNDQHIGPVGYPGLPFTFRMGLKLKVGGD